MTEYAIAHVGKGYQLYRLVNGRYRLPLGPIYPGPTEAARYADLLEAVPATSPLRLKPEPVKP